MPDPFRTGDRAGRDPTDRASGAHGLDEERLRVQEDRLPEDPREAGLELGADGGLGDAVLGGRAEELDVGRGRQLPGPLGDLAARLAEQPGPGALDDDAGGPRGAVRLAALDVGVMGRSRPALTRSKRSATASTSWRAGARCQPFQSIATTPVGASRPWRRRHRVAGSVQWSDWARTMRSAPPSTAGSRSSRADSRGATRALTPARSAPARSRSSMAALGSTARTSRPAPARGSVARPVPAPTSTARSGRFPVPGPAAVRTSSMRRLQSSAG